MIVFAVPGPRGRFQSAPNPAAGGTAFPAPEFPRRRQHRAVIVTTDGKCCQSTECSGPLRMMLIIPPGMRATLVQDAALSGIV